MNASKTLWMKLASTCLIALLAGCASTTPEWDTKFGDAARGCVAQQIVNPDASMNANPVNGLDGQSAEYSIQRYYQSFKSPTPQANVLSTGSSGVGTGSTSGSTWSK